MKKLIRIFLKLPFSLCLSIINKAIIIFLDLYLDFVYHQYGINGVNQIVPKTRFPKYILTKFGATIGNGTIVYPHIFIHGAVNDYSNLIIGKKCRILRNAFLDLTDRIEVRDRSIIGIGSYLITHINVGDAELDSYPTESGEIVLEEDVMVSTNSVILHGITIGKGTVIGAGSVVTKDIPPHSVAVGVPAKVIKKIS